MEIFGSMEDPEVRACVERLRSLGYDAVAVPDPPQLEDSMPEPIRPEDGMDNDVNRFLGSQR